MPSRKHKPCRSKKAAKSNFPQIRSLDPNQAGRDVVEDIMEGGRERWCFSPPRTYPSSIFSKDSSPAGGHRSSRPTQQQIRNLDPDQRGRDIPEEIMAEGQGSKDSSPPGGHRSSRPTQQQYRDRQPYVRRPQQYQDQRSYEPRPGQEGRHPHYPEQYPSSRGAERRVHERYPDQRGRDDPEEVMAEGRERRYSSPPGGHRSSNLSPKQYHHRQPYVRPTQQYYENQTYEPRPGPEGRHPHYPERPLYSGANRMIHDRYPDQRGRDDPEEVMAEGRESRDSTPPGRHRSSPPTQPQHSKRPGKPTPKAVDPTTQPILMNKKEASDTKPGPVDGPKLHQVGRRSSSPGLVTPSLAPPNPPTKDEPLLDEPSTALSVAAPEALNSLAETRTELETAGHDMRPQDPTPPQCPNSEAPLTLKSRSSSGKRGRKGRKRHNKPPYAGSPR